MFTILVKKNPILYGLAGVVSLGLTILVSIAVLLPLIQKKTHSRWEKFTDSKTSGEATRGTIELLNLLNTFHLKGRSGDAAKSISIKKSSREEIHELKNSLEAVKTEGSVQNAQNDLVALMNRWEEYVAAGNDTRELRDSFIALGEQYPWLRTLLWLIILNRL